MAGADSNSGTGIISIEIACALPQRQVLLALQVPAGTTLQDAVMRSGILAQFATEFSAHDLAALRFGVFGKLEKSPQSRLLREGDRVEIYRPLQIDPKEARRARAARARAARTKP